MKLESIIRFLTIYVYGIDNIVSFEDDMINLSMDVAANYAGDPNILLPEHLILYPANGRKMSLAELYGSFGLKVRLKYVEVQPYPFEPVAALHNIPKGRLIVEMSVAPEDTISEKLHKHIVTIIPHALVKAGLRFKSLDLVGTKVKFWLMQNSNGLSVEELKQVVNNYFCVDVVKECAYEGDLQTHIAITLEDFV